MPIHKRELAAYIILMSISKGDEIKTVDALNMLEIFYSRRTARKIIRMLNNAGFLEVYGDRIRVRECGDALKKFLAQYVRSRAYRRLKSHNIGGVELTDNTVVVECRDRSIDLCEKNSIEVPGILKVIFKHPQKTL